MNSCRYCRIKAAIKCDYVLIPVAALLHSACGCVCVSIRAADNWLEPRDGEGFKRENQIWTTVSKLIQADLISDSVFI